jgi:predicted metallopeptidase
MSLINKSLILIGIVATIIIYVVYQNSLKPSDKIVKNIADQYNINYSELSDIEIIKSYEDKGKIVYILNIKKSICEMPMIQINKEWFATGISCQG